MTRTCRDEVPQGRRRIPDDVIQQIKTNLPISDVCRLRDIELKKHGTSDLVGRCPFHDEKEASFIVTPEKNLFHCMGCDAAGSVIDLVMQLEKVDFRKAGIGFLSVILI